MAAAPPAAACTASRSAQPVLGRALCRPECGRGRLLEDAAEITAHPPAAAITSRPARAVGEACPAVALAAEQSPLILPACDSGLLASAGADELLGLASSLVPLGTAGIIASVVRVNDKAADTLVRVYLDLIPRSV